MTTQAPDALRLVPEALAKSTVTTEEVARLTLCGSTKFRAEYELWNKRLTLAGFLVYSVSGFGHSGDTFTDEEKARLDQIHLAKIDASHAIVVLNVGGYIGESTAREIAHAKATGKPVYYLEGDNVVYRLRTGPDGAGCLRYRAFDYAAAPAVQPAAGRVEPDVLERVAGRAASLKRIGADQDSSDLYAILAAISTPAQASGERDDKTYYGKDCPVGMVQVEFVGCPPSERYSDYGWKPTKSAFIDLYVDGLRYNISAGDIGQNCFDGKPRRGVHINYPMNAALGDRSSNALNLANPGAEPFWRPADAHPPAQASESGGEALEWVEGSWDGNPVPAQEVELRYFDGSTTFDLSDNVDWESAVAYRLTAGSEAKTPAKAALSAPQAAPGSQHDDHEDDEGRCDICGQAIKGSDLCANDVDLGPCHAACLEGAPVVDLETGEPNPDGEVFTYRWNDLPQPEPSCFAENANQAVDPRVTEWGYSSTDEALTHLGTLLDDQAAFDGLAARGEGEG